MRVLVVGGNGMVGGHAALRLAAAGHAVTIASRRSMAADMPLGRLPWIQLDYLGVAASFRFDGYDALVFAAGQDPRHVPAGASAAEHYHAANALGIPAFFRAAKTAGVARAILIGSFYPQAAPELVATNAYVASRAAADEGVRALADAGFHVAVLNAPLIVGVVPGLNVPGSAALARWALGRLDLPRVAPPGGTNVISCNTLSDAIEGALVRGRNARAWLIGDANLSYADYLGMFFAAAGSAEPLAIMDAPHALLPDGAMLRGRGATIFYDADPAERVELGYRQDDVVPTIDLIVATARATA